MEYDWNKQNIKQGQTFVRIDLYDTEMGVLFGEMTFFPMNGFMDFEREKDDVLLGSWIELPTR